MVKVARIAKTEEDCVDQERFPFKLWNIVNYSNTGAIIWSSSGKSILIDFESFQKEYLDNSVFKTNNIQSFIRQLNIYGFRNVKLKERDPACTFINKKFHEYYHKSFRRDCRDLTLAMNRQVKATSSNRYEQNSSPGKMDVARASSPRKPHRRLKRNRRTKVRPNKVIGIHNSHLSGEVLWRMNENDEFRKRVVADMSPQVEESRWNLTKVLHERLQEFAQLHNIESMGTDDAPQTKIKIESDDMSGSHAGVDENGIQNQAVGDVVMWQPAGHETWEYQGNALDAWYSTHLVTIYSFNSVNTDNRLYLIVAPDQLFPVDQFADVPDPANACQATALPTDMLATSEDVWTGDGVVSESAVEVEYVSDVRRCCGGEDDSDSTSLCQVPGELDRPSLFEVDDGFDPMSALNLPADFRAVNGLDLESVVNHSSVAGVPEGFRCICTSAVSTPDCVHCGSVVNLQEVLASASTFDAPAACNDPAVFETQEAPIEIPLHGPDGSSPQSATSSNTMDIRAMPVLTAEQYFREMDDMYAVQCSDFVPPTQHNSPDFSNLLTPYDPYLDEALPVIVEHCDIIPFKMTESPFLDYMDL